MRLVPREQDKLMLHYAGMLARDRKAQGLKLNYPEAVAYISMEVMEKARAGASAALADGFFELFQRPLFDAGDIAS